MSGLNAEIRMQCEVRGPDGNLKRAFELVGRTDMTEQELIEHLQHQQEEENNNKKGNQDGPDSFHGSTQCGG